MFKIDWWVYQYINSYDCFLNFRMRDHHMLSVRLKKTWTEEWQVFNDTNPIDIWDTSSFIYYLLIHSLIRWLYVVLYLYRKILLVKENSFQCWWKDSDQEGLIQKDSAPATERPNYLRHFKECIVKSQLYCITVSVYPEDSMQFCSCMHLFIHSFIHREDLYSTPSEW